MFSGVVAALAPLLAIVLGVGVGGAVVYRWRVISDIRDRQSPLCRDLLRSPGYSLQQKLRRVDFDIDALVFSVFLAPLMVYSAHISLSHFGGMPESGWRIAMSSGIVVAAVALVVRRLLPLLNERRKFALALNVEQATAEELNQLMLDGCRVFHDVPIRYGNVDHVIVSESGVYAINSKSFGKLRQRSSNTEVTVDYQRRHLQFPDRVCPIPVEDLRLEARCLSEHLSSAIGRAVDVEPMLALPGWCVKRVGRGLCVFNPRNAQKFFLHEHKPLSKEVVQQIAHRLEEMCRNVEPVFREKKRWD